MVKYSWKKGALKGLISLFAVGGSLLAFAGFSDLTLWGLLETYLRPVLGSLTVGGLVTFVLNWLKIRSRQNNTE